MKLLIVESPAKAKTISKYLDGAYEVKASVGHVRDLPKSNKKAIDIEDGFIPHYEISKGKEKVVSEIKLLAHKADEILLATDPDREGEAIAWHIAELISDGKKKAKNIKRVTYTEITKEAITEALKHPRDIDMNLKKAQEARRVLDRLFGYDLSGLIWKKVRYGLSAGRVQSPALRIIVEREREIRDFVPEDYWTIGGDFLTHKKEKLALTCDEEPRDKKEVDRILEEAKKNAWKVVDIKETKVKRAPRPPFTTSTLQQTASSRLGFAPARTMSIAQKLYEAGHITYMRTDSTTLSNQAIGSIASYIENVHGKTNLTVRTFTTKSKNAQEAHEAIRPTHIEKESAGNTDDEKKLYKLIRQRTLASQMSDAEVLRTKISATTTNENIPIFSAHGSRTLSPGWLIADPQAKGEDIELPEVSIEEILTLVDIAATAKQTQPPARYSEAGLIKELEARGIGRPSTYASTIKTLLDREYAEKVDRSLKPTDTGEVVSTFLENTFAKYISDEFTADMETDLDEIASGEEDYVRVLKNFYGPFTADVKAQEKSDKVTNLGKADKEFACPKCGSSMVIKLGRGGKFLSCEKYPECDGALMIDGTEIKKDEPLGTHPETGEPIYVKIGKYGPYVQLGDGSGTGKKKIKPKMASIPKEKNLAEVTIAEALTYLSLPKTLGTHPETGKTVTASVGRFGPYIAHDGNFRSVKKPDDVYTIELSRALELLAQEKKPRGFAKKKKTS